MKERKLVKTQSWSLFHDRFNHLNGIIQHLPPDVSDGQGGKAPGLKPHWSDLSGQPSDLIIMALGMQQNNYILN